MKYQVHIIENGDDMREEFDNFDDAWICYEEMTRDAAHDLYRAVAEDITFDLTITLRVNKGTGWYAMQHPKTGKILANCLFWHPLVRDK